MIKKILLGIVGVFVVVLLFWLLMGGGNIFLAGGGIDTIYGISSQLGKEQDIDKILAMDIPPKEPLEPATIHEDGWSTPIKVFNNSGWEDSPWIDRKGENIYLYYTPIPDMLSHIEAVHTYVVMNREDSLKRGIEGNIYVSKKPFKTMEMHPLSEKKVHPAPYACPYIDASGNFWHCSPEESFVQERGVPPNVYRNGERIAPTTNDDEGNPHFCDARSWLLIDCPSDESLCIMRDAEASNFTNKAVLMPHPINHKSGDTKDFQAFLPDGCNELYFTSDRQGNLGIFRSRSLDEQGFEWSEPELYISHKDGVAEVAKTADGKEMIWAQLFMKQSDEGVGIGLDIWYSKKEE